MAHYEDLTVDQGSDLSVELRLINKDESKKNLAGYSVAAKMAPNYNSRDSDKVAFTSIIANPDSDGIINLSLTNTQTDALSSRRKYVYDVEISYVDSDGFTIVERILEGNVTIKPSVTK